MCFIAYLYVIKANANPTNEIELPRTTPSATTPSWLPQVDPIGLFNDDVDEDMLKEDGKPWRWPVV